MSRSPERKTIAASLGERSRMERTWSKRFFVNRGGIAQKLLEGVNLRLEEVERTSIMFGFSTITSVGLSWLEATAVGLFLERYGANSLPLVYIGNFIIGSLVGVGFAGLQRFIPLRQSIWVICILMAVPLFLFRLGLGFEGLILAVSIALMRLWVEALYVINDLNISITSNQLFNIREVKRTYPIVSSGILVADVISGFSLPLLLRWVGGVNNIALVSCFTILVGAGMLFYISNAYRQAFPDAPSRSIEAAEQVEFSARFFRGSLRTYIIPLFSFFVCAELTYLLVDYQFLGGLEQRFESTEAANAIASFLGWFNGLLGIFEIVMQLFLSSRAIERLGVFVTSSVLPASLVFLGAISMGMTFVWPAQLFSSLTGLKFCEELLYYTLHESTAPVLFQPLPETVRSDIQAFVNGVIKSVAAGVTGGMIFALVWLVGWLFPESDKAFGNTSWVFVGSIVLIAVAWLAVTTLLLRSRYVDLLVSSAQLGRLGFGDVDMRAFKRAMVETLEKPGTEADKRSCIELLTQIETQNVGEILVPLLSRLTPSLQKQSLEVLLQNPSPVYLESVRNLQKRSLAPEVLALTLRYVWISEKNPDIVSLRPYLRAEVDPVVRGTASSLILRRGNPEQKAEATNVLRRMLTSKQEKERVMGCRALGEADYLQALRLYIPNLLQDESLRVRCALLEVIASTRYEEYYSSLLRGLYYKSTRDAAMRALVRLGNDALDRLSGLARDIHKPDLVRMYAWSAIGQIGTSESIDTLVRNLLVSWGITRRNLLQVLLKIPQEKGIEGVLDRVGRSGIEILIDQELMFFGQVLSALVDLQSVAVEGDDEHVTGIQGITDSVPSARPASSSYGQSVAMLYQALEYLLTDTQERLFLLMRLLYPTSSIQAAAFNLKSNSTLDMARGLEILDNTLDIPNKRALLAILDEGSYLEKLRSLSDAIAQETLLLNERVRRLLELRHFLSDWCLACCFHVAKESRAALTSEQTLAGLRHPRGFVREAVLSYLSVASPRSLGEVLPKFRNDSDRLVAAQAEQMMAQFAIETPTGDRSGGEP